MKLSKIVWVQLSIGFLLFSFHHVVGIFLSKGDYTPFSVGNNTSALVLDETQLYLPGVTRFYKTLNISREIDLKEFQTKKNGYPILHSLVLGTFAFLSGRVDLVWMISHSLFPTAIWGLLYHFIFYFTEGVAISSTFTWVVTLVSFGPRNFFYLGSPSFNQPLEITRIPHPAISFAVLLLTLHFCWTAIRKSNKTASLCAGLFSGLLFYSYYYYSVCFFSGLGLSIVLTFILGNKNLSKKLATIFLGGLVAGSAFIFNFYQASREGSQLELMKRVGSFSRETSIENLVVLLLFSSIFLFFHFKFSKGKSLETLNNLNLAQYLISLILFGASVGLNIQIATGYDAQHSHFFNRVIQPFSILLILSVVSYNGFIRNKKLLLSCKVITVCILCIAFYRQYLIGLTTLSDHRLSQSKVNILKKMSKTLDPNVVIGTTDIEMALLIPGIAGTWNFVPIADRTMASSEEILKRYLILCKVYGWSFEEVKTNLRQQLERSNIRPWFAPQYAFLQMSGNEAFEQMIQMMESIWNNFDIQSELKNKELNYLLLPTNLFLKGDFLQKHGTVVSTEGNWTLWKIL